MRKITNQKNVLRTNLAKCISGALFTVASVTGLQAQVTNLGDHYATDISDDGTVVVGDNIAQHFMWDATNGITLIGGVGPIEGGGQTAVNNNGTLISGTRIDPNSGEPQMGLYTVATQTWQSLGAIGTPAESSAWGMSSDGSTVVGLGWVNPGNAHGVKWTSTGGIEDLGSTVPNRSSRANVCNSDGTLIAGWQDDDFGNRNGVYWENGVQTQIFFPGGAPTSEIGCMSNDGVWFGGGGTLDNGDQAWIYSDATGAINIGPSPQPMWSGSATAFSQSGDAVIGFYRPFGPSAITGSGFYYTEADGMIDLNTYAESFNIDTQGLTFALPLGISADGRTIVGVARTSGGAPAGFILKLPASNGGPVNDLCENAIAISCNESVTGNTTNATDTGANPANDLYYTYTGNGTSETITASLCTNTDFDTHIRIFEDCTLTNEIAENDDACGVQSEVTFTSNGTDTYYILVEGAGSEVGSFTLTISCEDLGIENNTFSSFNYYPNPVNNTLHLENNVEISAAKIYTIAGQKVIDQTIGSLNGTIDTSSLSKGVYLISVEIENQTKTFKLVK